MPPLGDVIGVDDATVGLIIVRPPFEPRGLCPEGTSGGFHAANVLVKHLNKIMVTDIYGGNVIVMEQLCHLPKAREKS